MQFTRIQKEHFDQVLSIADAALGKNYITLNYLNKLVDLEQYYGYVALNGSQVIAFTSFVVLHADSLSQMVLKEVDWFNDMVQGCEYIGLGKQTIVDPQFAGRGIGYQLFDHSSKEAETLCSMQISTVWKKTGQQSMQRLLIKCGFNYIKTIEYYWYDDSMQQNYSCGVCGLPPCKCSTEVYFKKNASA